MLGKKILRKITKGLLNIKLNISLNIQILLLNQLQFPRRIDLITFLVDLSTYKHNQKKENFLQIRKCLEGNLNSNLLLFLYQQEILLNHLSIDDQIIILEVLAHAILSPKNYTTFKKKKMKSDNVITSIRSRIFTKRPRNHTRFKCLYC